MRFAELVLTLCPDDRREEDLEPIGLIRDRKRRREFKPVRRCVESEKERS